MARHPERRQDQRIRNNLIVSYYEVSCPEVRYDASQLKNISLGGICLVTPRAFAPSTALSVEFQIPMESDLTKVAGTVLESKEKLKGIIYETRVKFTGLSPEAKQILSKIIQHFDRHPEDTNHE